MQDHYYSAWSLLNVHLLIGLQIYLVFQFYREYTFFFFFLGNTDG